MSYLPSIKSSFNIYKSLLKNNRNFRFLWFGEIISHLGDWFNLIAIMSLLMDLTGKAETASIILILRSLPYFLLGPLAGVIADRFPKKVVMIVADLARALVVLAFLLVKRPEDIWIIYWVTGIEVSISAFFTPAKSAVIPDIVSSHEVLPANAISSATWSSMLTLGAVAGGAVSVFLGRDATFILNSISFLFSAYFILKVKVPHSTLPSSPLTLGHAWKKYIEGINYLKKHRDSMAYCLVKSGWGLAGGGVLVLLSFYGQKYYQVNGSTDAGIAILYASRGIGTALGPLLIKPSQTNTTEFLKKWIGYSFLIGALFFALFGWTRNIWIACLALLISNAGTSILWVFSTSLLQLTTPADIRGRVFATEWAFFTIMMSISSYVTGYGLDRLNSNPSSIVYIISLLIFLPGLIWWVYFTRRDTKIKRNT